MKTGDTLGPYRVLEKLGEGGMGEVYKANDTRLDRIVALKVLPEALAADPQFCERFDARGEEHLGAEPSEHLHAVRRRFLRLSRRRGRPACRLPRHGVPRGRDARGAPRATAPLPLADALKIAIEIASALDKAHRQGIVHRDLKPGNIMLVKSGGARSNQTQAKLLDFGLAKIGPAGAAVGVAPTGLLTSPRPAGQPLTAQGTILGTFQYMAPEQIDGEEADARTDIFAFGAVLFEMLTGRRAFSGKSQASLLGAILKEQPPPVSQVAPVAPPALDHVVGVCLAKDPDARFQTAHDLLLQLKWIAEGGSAAGVAAPAVAHRRNRERLAWIAAATLAVALVATGTMAVRHLREAPPVIDPIQFTISARSIRLFDGHGAAVCRLSRWTPGRLRRLAARGPRAVGPADRGGRGHSSDGNRVGLASVLVTRQPVHRLLRRKQIEEGAGERRNAGGDLQDADRARRHVEWRQRDRLRPCLERPASAGVGHGGAFTPVTELAKGETSHRWPTFLPDGRHFLYFVGTGDGNTGEIRTGSLDSKAAVPVVASDSNGLYAAGHCCSCAVDTSWPGRSIPTRGRSTAERVSRGRTGRHRQHGVRRVSSSTTNVLTYAHGGARAMARLTWFDRPASCWAPWAIPASTTTCRSVGTNAALPRRW